MPPGHCPGSAASPSPPRRGRPAACDRHGCRRRYPVGTSCPARSRDTPAPGTCKPPEGRMPQPNTVPRQQHHEPTELRPDLLRRRTADARYADLIGWHRLVTRGVVQRTIHGFAFESEVLAVQVVSIEEEIEHAFPVRWSRVRPRLLKEEAEWWGEWHDDDVLDCRTCRLLNAGNLDEQMLVLLVPADLAPPAEHHGGPRSSRGPPSRRYLALHLERDRGNARSTASSAPSPPCASHSAGARCQGSAAPAAPARTPGRGWPCRVPPRAPRRGPRAPSRGRRAAGRTRTPHGRSAVVVAGSANVGLRRPARSGSTDPSVRYCESVVFTIADGVLGVAAADWSAVPA